MSRKRHATIRTGAPLLETADARPPVDASAPKQPCKHGDPSGWCQGCEIDAMAQAHRFPGGMFDQSSQLDRANALARAREEGAREATIAIMAECAAIAQQVGRNPIRLTRSAAIDVRDAIIAELRRRFPNDPRVLYHLQMRGLG